MSCSTTNNSSRQDQWLARNYPDRATHLEALPASQHTASDFYRDNIIAGQVQLGMTLDEVLIAADTAPYGPKPYKGKFWCDQQPVPRCEPGCQACDGLIFLDDQVIWFNGESHSPTVVQLDRSRRQSVFATAPPASFKIAHALYHNEIIQGMSLPQVTRVLGTLPETAAYFCDNLPAQSPFTCQPPCTICRIEIRENGVPAQTIFLKQALGEYRVVRIEK
jgi:hypothetical protein